MKEINYYLIEVKKPWKKFQIAALIVFFSFILLEFDFIEIASFIIFLCFWAAIVVAFYFLVSAIIASTNYKILPYRKNLLIILILVLAIPGISLYRSGFFWGKPVLTGVFIDDRSRSDLELFENNRFIAIEGWLLGSEKYLGTYKRHGDTINFRNFPLTPDSTGNLKMLYKSGKLFFQADSSMNYDTSFYYYKVSKNSE